MNSPASPSALLPQPPLPPPVGPGGVATTCKDPSPAALTISTALLGTAFLVAFVLVLVVLYNAARAIGSAVAQAKARGDAQTHVLREQIKALDAKNALLLTEAAQLKTDLKFARFSAPR